ncbi:hypothetical protein [Streptomyces sp. NRRL F-5123]|uniref:hypothetical protein n=1 Tax=Streptomyces sp. NRRL F-5123 TaxID=1463856 RepID=UPI0004E16868|nr:hypothetical protein [Streptomyces sp. NRRL F-5123]
MSIVERSAPASAPDPTALESALREEAGGEVRFGAGSCGASAQAYGRTADSVRRPDVLTDDGTRCRVGRTPPEEFDAIAAQGDRCAGLYAGLRAFGDRCLPGIRRGCPKTARPVPGYDLDDLLPENGVHVARALVGSEEMLPGRRHRADRPGAGDEG